MSLNPKHYITGAAQRTLLLPAGFALLITLLFAGCRVQLLPNYDARISSQIVELARKVDQFYLLMLETPEHERSYDHYIEKYVDIESGLNSLLMQNRIKPLNENITRITEITLELWTKHKQEHKQDNTLNDALITLNRMDFNDLFYAMQVAEQAKQMISKPAE